MSAVDNTQDGSIEFDQDCSSVGDDSTVRADGRDFEGEITGIDETVEAALSELTEEL